MQEKKAQKSEPLKQTLTSALASVGIKQETEPTEVEPIDKEQLAKERREQSIKYAQENNQRSFKDKIPPRIKDIVLKEPVPNNLLKRASKIAARGGFIAGNVGTGKTVLFWKILFLRSKKYSRIVRASEMANQIRDLSDWKTFIFRLKRCDYLAIDDLGAEKITDHYLDTLYDLIDYRYNAKLPILATSNYAVSNPKDESVTTLKTLYGERVSDRMTEMWYNSFIVLKDRRRP